MTSTWEPTGRVIAITISLVQSSTCLGCFIFAIYIKWSNGQSIPHRLPYRNENLCRYPKTISFLTMLGLTSFLISSINETIRVSKFSTFQDLIIQEIVSSILISFCWSFGQFCSYIVFLLRLVDTFSDGTREIPRMTVIFMWTLLFLYEAAWTTKCVVPFVLWSDFTNSKSTFKDFEVYMTISLLILDFVVTIVMTYMFLSRLIVVMRSHANTFRDRNLQMIALHQSLSINGCNYQLMNLSVKIAVLSTISLLSSLTVVSFDALSYYLDNFKLEGSLVLAFTVCFQVDLIISSVCLTLFLPASRAERIYRIICCCGIAVGYRCMRKELMKH